MTFDKRKKPVNSNNIEIYLLCDTDQRRISKRVLQLPHVIGNQWHKVDQKIRQHPVFLDKRSAVRYSRFLGASHVVLKAYIAESAIAGAGEQHFILKNGALTKQRVHGGFINSHTQSDYLENPYFDPAHSSDENTEK